MTSRLPVGGTIRRVYIAGPYTLGDVAANVARAIRVAHVVMDFGHAPFCPHLHHFAHLQRQRPYEDWIRLDNAFVAICDDLIRIPGDSKGADDEVKLATANLIPVFYDVRYWIDSLRVRVAPTHGPMEAPVIADLVPTPSGVVEAWPRRR